jgi:hypothetical protein
MRQIAIRQVVRAGDGLDERSFRASEIAALFASFSEVHAECPPIRPAALVGDAPHEDGNSFFERSTLDQQPWVSHRDREARRWQMQTMQSQLCMRGLD